MNVLEVIRDFLNNYGAWQPRGFCSKKAQDRNWKSVMRQEKVRNHGQKDVLFGPCCDCSGGEAKFMSPLFNSMIMNEG
jgi:hypothetical protein